MSDTFSEHSDDDNQSMAQSDVAESNEHEKHREGRCLDDKDAIFARQLAEVYLLIDNVSNFPNKEIPSEPANNAQFKDAFGGTNWLSVISAIPWPPHIRRSPPGQPDKMAAQLICARDLLNNAATPANGMTIAFTQTVLNEKGVLLRDIPFWLLALPGLLWRKLAGAFSPDQGGGDDPHRIRPLTLDSLSDDIATGNLASIAYPGMRREARAFQIRVFFLAVMLCLFTLVTFSLSWTVATGSALLASDLAARGDYVAARTDILNAEQNKPSISQSGDDTVTKTTVTTSADPAKSPAPVYGYDAETFCARPAVPAANGSLAPQRPIDHHVLCGNLMRQTHRLDTAQFDLAQWNIRESGPWSAVMIPRLAALTAWRWRPSPKVPTHDEADVDTQWPAAWLHVMGGIVLPILYGVLGAGAAAGRMLSARMRDNTLTPRDSLLAWVHVGLGSIVGGCIGLFFTPADATTAPSAGHLSTSALCFLAGFAVEGVFQMLERMAAATFNTGSSPTPKKT